MKNSLFSRIVISCALSAVCSIAIAFEKPTFPRVGAYLSGDTAAYVDPNFQATIARLDMVVMTTWPGWGISGLTTPVVTQRIKAINPKTLVFMYMNINELDSPVPTAFLEIKNNLDQNHWWLTNSAGNGGSVKSAWGDNFYMINTSSFTTRNSSGQRYIDWRASWQAQLFSAPNPQLDGFFTDNVIVKPRVDGDWNMDGNVDAQGDPTVQTWFRKGMADYISAQRAAMPGKYQLGNVGDWGAPDANVTEYAGILNGGVLEYMIGQPFSVETWGGWQALLSWYRKTMANLGEPKLGLLQQVGDPNDYRSMRYGLTTTLMDDGYYAFAVNDDGHSIKWFDEYDANLGNATSAPPTSAWQSGVYRRDFENGIALVNPKGNGAKTVTLEGDFRRLSGTQDPGTNTGQTVRSVTIQDRDGIILKRMTTVSRPNPPTGTLVR